MDKNNKKLLKIFFRVTFLTVFFFTILFWIIGKTSVLMFGGMATGPSNIFYDEEVVNNKEEGDGDEGKFLRAPDKTNFLLTAVDRHEMLTDIMLVGSFDSESQMIDIIQIPRDTYTELSSKEQAKLRNAGINAPNSMKMNAVHSYTGSTFGMTFLEEHIEEFLGIEIDYYAKINIDGFRAVVDAIGGVDFYVPQDMYYDDPYQDLHIDLKEGQQTLNGEQAEGLVRYRATYAGGDLERIKVQQDFMYAFFDQVLSLKALTENPIELSKIFLDNVETNFNIVDVPRYVPYIPGLSVEKFNLYTMPYDAEATSRSNYVVPDMQELSALVNDIFYSERIVSNSVDDIYEKSIQVLNGSRTNGLAGKTAEQLTSLGFKVLDIGDFNGEYRNETVIKVKPGTNVEELEKLFDDCVVEYNGRQSDTYDVVIILGLEEDGIDIDVPTEEE